MNHNEDEIARKQSKIEQIWAPHTKNDDYKYNVGYSLLGNLSFLFIVASEENRILKEEIERIKENASNSFSIAADEIDCGCEIRDFVIHILKTEGRKRASYHCGSSDTCCALLADEIRQLKI